jgi:hypothetical protein
MSDIKKIISGLLGKIFLTKKVFFGIDEQKIIIVLSPSLKIFDIVAKPKRLLSKFPFEKNRILPVEQLKIWALENGYDISFSSTVPSFNRRMLLDFGDVVVEGALSKEKSLHMVVLEEIEKSHLPESVKEWAIANPEKFIENLERVKKTLGDK